MREESGMCSGHYRRYAVQKGEVAMRGEKLRDGIFALRTRRFGSVAECMVKRLLKCSLGRNLFHDLYDDVRNQRIEVKFSVVQKRAKRPSQSIQSSNVLRKRRPKNAWWHFLSGRSMSLTATSSR